MPKDFSNFTKAMTPQLNYLKTQPRPLEYEKSIFKKQADDIKEPLEHQLKVVEDIAIIARSQAESSKEIASSAQIQSDIAVKKSKKADVKGWFAIFISLVALALEFFVNREDLLSFFFGVK